MQFIQKYYAKHKRLLTHDELCELIIKAQQGDIEARNKIIEGNMGLLIQATFRKLGTTQGLHTIELDDIFQESVFGINRAIELFNINKGFAFSTYAMHWINQSIERYILNFNSLVRVPVYAGAIQSQYSKLQIQYAGKDEDFYIKLIAFEANKTPQSIKAGLQLRPKISSTDIVNDDGDPIREFENLTYENNVDILDATVIKRIADLLPSKDKKVLMLRMQNYTLWSIAEMIGVSREMVRQIEKRALIKLRALVNQTKGA